jgi:hypothetical protein
MGKKKKDNVPVAAWPMSPSTITRLDTAQPLFKQKMQARADALSAQSASTSGTDAQRNSTRMYISHYFQAFNNGVARGMFTAAERAYYKLDISSEAVPALDSDEKLLTWGANLIEGDAQRIAAGGAAMAMPTTAEVDAVFSVFATSNQQQSNLKDAYDQAQEAVSSMRNDVDSLILRMWNEIEASFSEEDAPSKRRKAREWGVVYISSPGEGTEKEGNIASNLTITLFEGLTDDNSITVRNTGTSNLLFFRSETKEPSNSAPPMFGRLLHPAEELTLPLAEFGPTGGFLNLRNPDMMEGSYYAKLEAK